MGQSQTITSSILGKIAGLFREFNKIAAKQGVNVAELARSLPGRPSLKAPDANDGMLGSLILEQLLIPVFSQVSSDYLISTSGGSISGTVMAIDIAQTSDFLDSRENERATRASDDTRYKKGAGKGTEALLFGNTKKPSILSLFSDDGRGFFTSPFNSKAQKRLESALIESSRQLMDLERFAATPA